MNADAVIAEYEVRSGAQRGSRLTLHGNRLVQQGVDLMEVVPLSHLASVRVAFERDIGKLNWAIVLLVLALILASVSGPLAAWMQSLASKLTAVPERAGLESALIATFHAVGVLARLMLPLAALLVGGALALAVFFWIGHTTLALSFAATERICAVRGRDRFLQDFAETLAARVAAVSAKN